MMNENRVAQYIQQKEKLVNTTFVIRPTGEGFFISEGVEYEEREFMRMNAPMLMPLARDNYDRTKNWMQNKKSW